MIFKQRVAETIGAEGCYFLSLMFIAEQILGHSIDAFELYDLCVSKGWMKKDCYVLNPPAIMSCLLGKPCDVKKVWDLSYKPAANERTVTCYERKATGTTYYHYVVTEGGKVVYDPLENSNTVRLGRPISLRVLSIGG